jgi:hypothetical protein
MSSHYHVALRTSAVSLSRTLLSLQGGFSRSFNRRWRRSGPVWQSRYQTRVVDEQRYFDQLVVYVHLNPVRAGIVKDPGDHPFSGHRELLGRVQEPLVDVEEALSGFGETLRGARRAYLARIAAALEEETGEQVRLKAPRGRADRELRPVEGRPYVDVLGRSTGLERPRVEAVVFVQRVCELLGIEPALLTSGRRDRETVRHRELIAAVGIERWGLRAGDLGRALGKHPDVVSRWVRIAASRRAEDPALAELHEHLDHELAGVGHGTAGGPDDNVGFV